MGNADLIKQEFIQVTFLGIIMEKHFKYIKPTNVNVFFLFMHCIIILYKKIHMVSILSSSVSFRYLTTKNVGYKYLVQSKTSLKFIYFHNLILNLNLLF